MNSFSGNVVNNTTFANGTSGYTATCAAAGSGGGTCTTVGAWCSRCKKVVCVGLLGLALTHLCPHTEPLPPTPQPVTFAGSVPHGHDHHHGEERHPDRGLVFRHQTIVNTASGRHHTTTNTASDSAAQSGSLPPLT